MSSTSTDRRQGVNSGAAIKVPCRAASTVALVLNGEQTIDGVACVTGDRVLVKNQAAPAQNGIYVVDSGAWTRALDFDGVYDVLNGTIITVLSGNTNGSTGWKVSAVDPVIPGTTSLALVSGLFNDASLIYFIQAGAGAVQRTVQNRLRDTVNVKDFGALGDGATDDTAAFQAAITALGANGGTIEMPAGNFKITAALVIGIDFAVPIRFVGEGAYATKITYTGAGILFSCRTAGYAALMLENLYIIGPGKNVVGSICADGPFAYGRFDRVTIVDFEKGISCTGGNLTRCDQLNVAGCKWGIYLVNAVLSASILLISRSWMSSCTTCVRMENGGTLEIDGSYFEQNDTSIDVRTTSFVNLKSVYTEGETSYGLFGIDVYPTMNDVRFVSHEPHLEYSAGPSVPGWIRTSGLRLQHGYRQMMKYVVGSKSYEVAHCEWADAAGVLRRVIGDSTSNADAFEAVTAAGEITNPLQPAAHVTLAADTSNDKTGDGTVYTVVFDTEGFDQNADFDPTTGTFTAPIAGKYEILANVMAAGLGAGHTTGELWVYNSGTSVEKVENNPGGGRSGSNRCSLTIATTLSLAAGDTITIRLAVSGSTKTVGVSGGKLSSATIKLVA